MTYVREAECACDCGIGVFPTPCACLTSQVTRKTVAEIEGSNQLCHTIFLIMLYLEIHNQIVSNRKSRMVCNIINEVSIFQNPDPPEEWEDLTRDPCGLIFASSSRKDQVYDYFFFLFLLSYIAFHRGLQAHFTRKKICESFSPNK